MNRAAAIKYYATMPQAALRRLLEKPLVPRHHKQAIEVILASKASRNSRLHLSDKETRQVRDHCKPIKTKKLARDFGLRAKHFGKQGRILQGGAVNPR